MTFYAIVKTQDTEYTEQVFEAETKKEVKAQCKENGMTVQGGKVYTEEEWQLATAHPMDSNEDDDFEEYAEDAAISAGEDSLTAEIEAETPAAEQLTFIPENNDPVSTETEERKPKMKGSRWLKIHQPGQANFETADNVIDVQLGESRCQAEVVYNTKVVRNFKKAAYWLFHSLTVAQADKLYEIISEAYQQVQSEVENFDKDAEKFAAAGEGWNCEIENLGNGVFKTNVSWAVA